MTLQERECSQGITKHLTGGVIALSVAFVAYFSLYFATAEYIDVGSNTPMYFLRYRIGSCYLDRFARFFEPARRIDAAFIRKLYPLTLNPQSDETLQTP